MSRLTDLFRKSKSTSANIVNDSADITLYLRVSDSGWTAYAVAKDGMLMWREHATCVAGPGAALTAQILAACMTKLAETGRLERVGRLFVLADDSELQLLDHRMAKLTNFEPRAVKEFGAQLAGGRPVAFSTRRFGITGEREIERRILAFLPEEKLGDFFFGLGRMATSLAAVAPAIAETLAASETAGVFACLRVHGYYAHLLIANMDSGIVAMRRLPIGALTLAQSFAGEHGVSLDDAVAALAKRARVPAAEAVSDETAPEHRTATFAALAPHLKQLADEIAATMDYFRFERLGGSPTAVRLSFSGPVVLGLDSFLANACVVDVETVDESLAVPVEVDSSVALNLLEGSRSGLLKLGGQSYEFFGGKFRPVGPGHAQKTTKSQTIFGMKMPVPVNQRMSDLATMRITLRRDQIMRGLAVCAPLVLVAILNMNFLKAPAESALAMQSSAYATAAARETGFVSRLAAENGPVGVPATQLWANDMVSIAGALLPDMLLSRIEMTSPDPASKSYVLNVEGTLSAESQADLKSVAEFIERLNEDSSFKRRFADIKFAGAATNGDSETQSMKFNISARAGAGATP